MPRLATSLIKQAKRIHPSLHVLLRPCRDLESARNELRWLREHQLKLAAGSSTKVHDGGSRSVRVPSLHELCLERARGRPLQYILGTQPFGNLDILCRKGVLIPRSQTEGYILRLATRLTPPTSARHQGKKPVLRIIDMGTGSGCMLLLMIERLHRYYDFVAVGIDTSPTAIRLARRNLHRNIALGVLPASIEPMVRFQLCDMTDQHAVSEVMDWAHVIMSNPPYIPEAELRSQSERSVRLYEPRCALVAETLPGLGLTKYEEVLLKYCNERRSFMSLTEFVDEQRALTFARSAVESQAEKGPLRIEVWREDGAADLPAHGSDARSAHSEAQLEGTMSELIDQDVGAVQAVVSVAGKWSDWFPQQESLESCSTRLANMSAVSARG